MRELAIISDVSWASWQGDKAILCFTANMLGRKALMTLSAGENMQLRFANTNDLEGQACVVEINGDHVHFVEMFKPQLQRRG